MQKVVFQKLSPHDTLFIEESADLEVKYVCNNQFVQFQIWDFPGDYDLHGGCLAARQ
jgi:Ras-related GTP-binding protein C/D